MITLPRRSRGYQSDAARARYEAELAAFRGAIREINSRLDFKVSSRGWAYILEEHGLAKGDFDRAQALINACRTSGDLGIGAGVHRQVRPAEGRGQRAGDPTGCRPRALPAGDPPLPARRCARALRRAARRATRAGARGRGADRRGEFGA